MENSNMEEVNEIIDMFFAQKSLYERANGTYVDPREEIINDKTH